MFPGPHTEHVVKKNEASTTVSTTEKHSTEEDHLSNATENDASTSEQTAFDVPPADDIE